MKRRWCWILLTAPVAALAMGVGWHRLTPDWNEAYIPWQGPDTLCEAYTLLLAGKSLPRSLGYTDVQRGVDDAARRRSREPFIEIQSRIDALRAKGATLDEAIAYRKAQLPAVEIAAYHISYDLPSLTDSQRSALFPAAVRWAGVWLLMDRNLAQRVGLSERQRQLFDRSAELVRRYYLDEQHAEQRDSAIFDGAPPSALIAMDETYRFNSRVGEANLSGLDPAVHAEYERLARATEFTPSREMPRWLDALHYDLVVRRVVAYRRSEENRLLGSLTPEQRARWDAILRG